MTPTLYTLVLQDQRVRNNLARTTSMLKARKFLSSFQASCEIVLTAPQIFTSTDQGPLDTGPLTRINEEALHNSLVKRDDRLKKMVR